MTDDELVREMARAAWGVWRTSPVCHEEFRADTFEDAERRAAKSHSWKLLLDVVLAEQRAALARYREIMAAEVPEKRSAGDFDVGARAWNTARRLFLGDRA
jgi:hypothetical protein